MIKEKRDADELLMDAIVLNAIKKEGEIDLSQEADEAKAALSELELQLIQNETKKAVQRYAAQQKRKRVRRYTTQIAACMLIILLLASLPALSIKAVRNRVIEFLVIKFDQFSLLPPQIVVDSEMPSGVRVEPTWLPSPYQHKQVIIDDGALALIYYYDDTGEEFISFQVNYLPVQMTINTEDSDTEQFEDKNRTIFVSERADEIIVVAVDHQSGYQFSIGGKNLSQDDILKILDSIEEVR